MLAPRFIETGAVVSAFGVRLDTCRALVAAMAAANPHVYTQDGDATRALEHYHRIVRDPYDPTVLKWVNYSELGITALPEMIGRLKIHTTSPRRWA